MARLETVTARLVTYHVICPHETPAATACFLSHCHADRIWPSDAIDGAAGQGKEPLIACELTRAPRKSDIPVFDSAKEVDAPKGSYHYKLWIPKGYKPDTLKRWPCMFIMSASGNAPMATNRKANGFVVVMLVETKNGPWAPSVGNFLAAHHDVIKRVRVQEGQKFTTGMSGGARASSVFAQARPGFAGLILQGAGPSADSKGYHNVADIKRNSKLCVAMMMGVSDSNESEVKRTQDALLHHASALLNSMAGTLGRRRKPLNR